MKKIITLIAIFAVAGGICVCGAGCSKKDEKQRPAASKKVSEKSDKKAANADSKKSAAAKEISDHDIRMSALREKAQKMYPTKESARKNWLNNQEGALLSIEETGNGISAEVFTEIRAAADKRYPDNYERQLDFILKQKNAAVSLLQMMADAAMSPEDAKLLMAKSVSENGGDYAAQAENFANISAVYERIKSKSAEMKPEDFAKLRPKILEILARNPEDADNYFRTQALARHNYLTKTIPAQFGNLRAGIEESFPGDFSLQLEELNKRVEKVMRAGPASADGFVSQVDREAPTKFFAKYSRICCDTKFCGYITKINDKLVYLFPSDALSASEKSPLEAGDLKLDWKNVFVSNNSMYSMILLDKDADVEAAPFMTDAEISAAEKIDGVLIAYDQSSRLVTYDCEITNGVPKFGAVAERAVKMRLINGGIIIDKKTMKAVGLFEIESNPATDVYDIISSSGDLDGYLSSGENNSVFAGAPTIFQKYKADMLKQKSSQTRIVRISDLKEWQAFVQDKYNDEMAVLKGLCYVNYWTARLMLKNSYADTYSSSLYRPAAVSHEAVIIKGPKLELDKFYREYSSYAKDLYMLFGVATNAIKPDEIKGFYYPIKVTAEPQLKLMEELRGYFKESVKLSGVAKILHNDISSCIYRGIYTPPKNLKMDEPAKEQGFTFMYTGKKTAK